MKKRRGVAAKVAATLVLAVGGFTLAAVVSGVGFAGGTTSGSTSTPTDTTTTTPTEPPPTTTQPPGGEGCTPGFWKNHTEDWVGYTPGQTVGSVFANAGSLGSMTLLQALKNGGGETLDDAKRLLIHHAVAALLNSTHPDVDYAFTTAQVIALTSDMLTSTDRDAILGLKDLFDTENNRGCTVR